ncbi:MAG: SCO family protein [Betaproteobacteria bacterium]
MKLPKATFSHVRHKATPWLIAAALVLFAYSSMPAAHTNKDLLGELKKQVPYMQLTDRAAPAFALEDADGRKVSLGDLKGSVLVLNFIYTRCTDACPLHMILIAQVQDQVNATLMRDQVRFVTLATDTEPPAQTAANMRAYGKAHGMDATNWMILHGGSAGPEAGIEVAKAYGLEFTPTLDGQQMHGVVTHIIDADGVMRARFHGLKFPALSVTTFINTLLYPDHHASGAEAVPGMNADASSKEGSYPRAASIPIWLWPILAALMFGVALLAVRGARQASADTEPGREER